MPRKSFRIPNDTSDEFKRAIADYLARQIWRRGWTQAQAAARTGGSRANMSRLMNRRLDTLSFNQLFRYVVFLTPYARLMISND